MTDPIADLLTRIRNGLRNNVRNVVLPYSNLKKSILSVLKANGYIRDFEAQMQDGRATIRVDLKYGPDGEQIIRHIQRVSKPGRRVYRGVKDLPNPLNGLGLAVISTPKGVLSHVEAQKQNVGGEVLCDVW
jgi:small subunit ribosomal protein S8